MERPNFQRARRPAEISSRREALLAAAGELFDAEGPNGAGLNAIAARAGFTKSNVYRYFESREAVLINLHLGELAAMTDAVEARLAACEVADIEGAVEAMTKSFLERPRLGRLLSILASVLEENVSREAIIATKRESRANMMRLVTALNRILPNLSPEECGWTWTVTTLFVVGLWPAAHPARAVVEVLAAEEFCQLRLEPERDVKRGVLTILRGVIAESVGQKSRS
jgi:TetR/AcrR family transcriptional regulator